MSLNCLKDHIGVEGCTSTTPNSGIYVNQLPGIELKLLDRLANEQQVNFQGVWDDVQERAVRRLRTDIRAFFENKYRIKTITQNAFMGRVVDTGPTTGAAANYRGIQLELNADTDDFVPSNLQVINVQSVDLYFTALAATTIVIYDLDTLERLLNQAVAAPTAIGWTTINIYGSYSSRRIFIGYDATLLAGVLMDTTEMENATLSWDEGCDCHKVVYDGSYYCDNCNATLEGASSTIAAPTTITEGDNSFGLSVRWNVECSYDGFVCNNRELFTTALWYLLGAEVTWERMYSSRLNEFTAFDQEKAQRLNQMYEAKYRGGKVDDVEYRGELQMVLDGIRLDENDCCLECSSALKIVDAVI